MQPYLYKEGFVYHLMPLKVDTANKDQAGKTNTMVMYDKVMNKFKFGNFKTEDEANPYKKEISKMLNGATIYYLPETIEVKPDKDFDPDNIQ